MANRSRLKSEEEYKEIIGNKIEDTELKVTHDASRYFDELRESKSEERINPFEKKVSMDDLKTSIQSKSSSVDVDQIKEEIAKIQVEASDDSSIIPIESFQDNQDRRFSFEENARKLYENLRESKTSYYEKEIEPKKIVEEKIDTIEVVTPSIIGIKTKEDEIEKTTNNDSLSKEIDIDNIDFSIEDEPEKIEAILSEDNFEEDEIEDIPSIDLSSFKEDIIKENDFEIDELEFTENDLIADFSEENESLLELLGMDYSEDNKDILEEVQDNIEEANKDNKGDEFNLEDYLENNTESEDIETEEIEEIEDNDISLSEEKEDEDYFINNALLDLINKQAEDNEEETIFNTLSKDNDLLSQINKESNEDESMDFLNKKPVEAKLGDTLTLALNKEDSISFSPNELRELKEEDFKDNEPQKRKPIDIILSILLVVMIIVVAYILFQMISGS